MNAVLVMLSYIVWLAPAVFIFILFQKSARETGNIEGFTALSTGLVFISVAVTIKQSLIRFVPDNLMFDLIYGNLLIGISYLAVFISLKQRYGKLLKPPRRMFVYISYFAVLIVFALFRGESGKALDFAVYASTISLVIMSVELSAERFEKGRIVPIVIQLFALSLIFDFTLKCITELYYMQNLRNIKLLGFSVRFVFLFLLIYIAKNVYFEGKKEELAEIRHATAQFLKKALFVIIAFSVVADSLIFVSAYAMNYTIRKDYISHADTAKLDAARTIYNIRTLFSKTYSDLENLAVNRDVINLTEKGKEMLKNYYLNGSDRISSITRMDKNGVIAYTYPFTKSIGKSVIDQPHIKKLFETYLPILSDPILTVQGFPAVIIVLPVFKDGTFDGALAALFALSKLGKETVYKNYPSEKIVISDANGTIILAPDDTMLFKNIATVFPERNGARFIRCRFGEGLLITKTFKLMMSKIYTAYAFIPIEEVHTHVLGRILVEFLIGLMLILFFIISIRIFYASFETETIRIEKIAEREYKKSKIASQKLAELVNLFSGVSIKDSINEMSDKILNSVLKVIRGGNAGSILIKNGDEFVFTSVNGYPKELVGKALTKDEIVPSVSKKPFVIKHIFEEMKKVSGGKFKAETRRILQSSKSEDIKATIEAPIIVDDEYYGGIFIDSFESENAFTEEDLKIAESVSKLSSIFIKSKLLFNSLEETENTILYIMENFARLDINTKEGHFYEEILSVAKRLISSADAGSIVIKEGGFFKYKAIFGYGDSLKSLSFTPDNSYKTYGMNAKVVRDIAEYNMEKLSEEQLEILSESGAFRIKQTLVAPIIANGEYFGGIFLDSFKEGDVFTERDLKIATALSRLSSIFANARIALTELKEESKRNEASVLLFHKANTKSDKEYILKSAYNILTMLYGKELQEVAVWEVSKGKPKLVKYDGKQISLLPMSSKSLDTVFNKRASSFIEKDEKFHRYAQALIYTRSSYVPVFRVRFNGVHGFDRQEKAFLERFGGEVVSIYQMAAYYTLVRNLLANYIFSIGNAISAYDPYTEGHSLRVAYLSMLIGSKMGLGENELSLLVFSAVLHDVGKLGISQQILLKKGKLTKEEFAVMKRHPIEGKKIVAPINEEAAKIIRHHHEKWNGKGYPDGLKGEEIPLLSRIITVADVFDALTTDRPYRKAYTTGKALEIMISEKGETFDPHVLDVFLSLSRDIIMKKELCRKDIEEMQNIITNMY